MRLLDAYCTPGTERECHLPIQDLLLKMDAAGIDAALIAPEDREITFHNEEGNTRILQASLAHPERLIPAFAVNPWRSDALPLAQTAHASGGRVLVLDPSLQGWLPGDPLATPLLNWAGERQIPVYLHAGPSANCTPSHVFFLALGHPQTRFILGHCGSTDYAYDMSAVIKEALPNLWFELSFARPAAVALYAQIAAADRLIFGSGAPRADAAFELKYLMELLPPEKFSGIYGENFSSLLAL